MKVIIITGTTRGLGKAMLTFLAESGHRAIAIARNVLPEQKGMENISFIIEDLSKSQGVISRCKLEKALPDDTEEICFIDNAAVLGPVAPVGNLTEKSIIDTINVNFVTPLLLTNHIVRLAQERACQLKILHISTGAAHQPIAGWSLYCSSKGASHMFYDIALAEGINVSSVDPGVMNTNMQHEIRAAAADVFSMRDYFINLRENNDLKDPIKVAEDLLEKYILI